MFAYVLIGLCIVAALGEFLNLTFHAAALAGNVTMASSYYHERYGLQRVLMFATVVTALGLIAFLVVRPVAPGKRPLVIGLIVFYSVAATRVVSLHVIDAVLMSPWYGVPIYQWANLVASGLAAFGARRLALQGPGPMPPCNA